MSAKYCATLAWINLDVGGTSVSHAMSCQVVVLAPLWSTMQFDSVVS